MAQFNSAQLFSSAASRTAGFQRVLALIANHPWLVRPLVVDPGHTLSPLQRRAAIQVLLSP